MTGVWTNLTFIINCFYFPCWKRLHILKDLVYQGHYMYSAIFNLIPNVLLIKGIYHCLLELIQQEVIGVLPMSQHNFSGNNQRS